MPTIARSRFVLAATVLTIGALFVGCATPRSTPYIAPATQNPVPDQPAPVTSIPHPTGPNQLRELPIMTYLLNSEQSAQLTNATGRLVTPCMKSHGFDYTPPQATASTSALRNNDPTGYLPDSDPQAAATQGYRDRAAVDQQPPAQSGPPMSQAERVALIGNPTAQHAINGQSIPIQGCLGAARQTIAGAADPGIVFGDAQLATDIRLDGYTRALSDSRVLAVFAQWSTCMRAKGFAYSSPVAAVNDPRWDVHHPPGTLEITTAVADVGCKYQDNVNGVFHAVETAFEDAAIQQNLAALQRISAARDAALRKAAQIIAQP